MNRVDNLQYPDADVGTGRSLFDTNKRILDLVNTSIPIICGADAYRVRQSHHQFLSV